MQISRKFKSACERAKQRMDQPERSIHVHCEDDSSHKSLDQVDEECSSSVDQHVRCKLGQLCEVNGSCRSSCDGLSSFNITGACINPKDFQIKEITTLKFCQDNCNEEIYVDINNEVQHINDSLDKCKEEQFHSDNNFEAADWLCSSGYHDLDRGSIYAVFCYS